MIYAVSDRARGWKLRFPLSMSPKPLCRSVQQESQALMKAMRSKRRDVAQGCASSTCGKDGVFGEPIASRARLKLQIEGRAMFAACSLEILQQICHSKATRMETEHRPPGKVHDTQVYKLAFRNCSYRPPRVRTTHVKSTIRGPSPSFMPNKQ